jgi:PAS domain S-box-containing protein
MTTYLLSGARIGTRLAACFVMIVVAMLVADAVAIWLFNMTAAPAERLARADRISLSVMRVHFDIDSFKDNLAALASTRDIGRFKTEGALFREKFLENVAQCGQLIELSADAQQDPVIRSTLETLRATLPSQLDATLDLASAGDWVAVDHRMRNQVQALVQLSSLLVQKVEAGLAQERAEAIESGYQARRRLFLILPAVALLTLLVAVVLGWNVTRSIVEPLSQLEDGARALAKGDFGHRVATRGEDELAELGRVMNDSAEQLAVVYETLRDNEARFRLTIDTIPAFVWSALPDGSVDFINKRWLEFSGLSLEQGLDFGWEIAVHPEDRPPFMEAWSESVASGKAMEFEARVRRADGQYRWLLIRNVPLHDEAANIVKWYGTSTDIDDRKRMEEALRRSEAYLAESQKLTHTGSWAWDVAAGEFVYWSEDLFRIYGIDPQQGPLTRERVFQRILPEDLAKVDATFHKSVREKVDTSVEFRIVLPDRTVRHVYVIRHPVLNDAGDLVQLVGTSMDITERKRAEEERERLHQLEADLAHINRVSMMGELSASIAHEVNQPLSGIVSNGSACLRWLAGDAPNLEEAREAAQRIVRDGKRAGEVIARIRSLTKRAPTPQEDLDLNKAIQEVLDIVGDKARGEGVTIRTQFARDLAPVSGDRVQLQQVVLNLVMNGIEALRTVHEGARDVFITTRNIGADQVQVSVEDLGPGMDPDTIGKIFNPFFTTKPDGTGMGLSISRSILESHRGRLWAVAREGPGSAFHFVLPRNQEAESSEGNKAI